MQAIPERWGAFSYHAEHKHAATLATYIRIDLQGHQQVVLDPNQVQTPSGLVSIGQVKISRDQSMLAYTVDAGDGTEAYNATIQVIGMPWHTSTSFQCLDLFQRCHPSPGLTR